MKKTNRKEIKTEPKLPNQKTIRKMSIKDLEKLSDMTIEELERREVAWTWARVGRLVRQKITDPDMRKKYLALLDDPQVRKSRLLTIREGEDILTALGLCLI